MQNVCLYICVLVGLFMACDLVHAVLSSVAAEKQHYYHETPSNKDDPVDITALVISLCNKSHQIFKNLTHLDAV